MKYKVGDRVLLVNGRIGTITDIWDNDYDYIVVDRLLMSGKDIQRKLTREEEMTWVTD